MKHSHHPQNACRVKRCGNILKFQVNKSVCKSSTPAAFIPVPGVSTSNAPHHTHGSRPTLSLTSQQCVCLTNTHTAGCSAGTQTAPCSTYFGRDEILFNHVLTLISRFCSTFGLLVTWKLFKGHGFEFHQRPHTHSVCCRKLYSPFLYWSHSISATTLVSKNTKVTSWNVKMSAMIVAGKLATATAGLWKQTHRKQSSAACHWPK